MYAHPSYFTLKSQPLSRKDGRSSPLSPVLPKGFTDPFPLQIASGRGKIYAMLLDEFKLLSGYITQTDEYFQIPKEIFGFANSSSHIINQFDRKSIQNLKLSQIIASTDLDSSGDSNELQRYGLSKRKNLLPMLCKYPFDDPTKPAVLSKCSQTSQLRIRHPLLVVDSRNSNPKYHICS